MDRKCSACIRGTAIGTWLYLYYALKDLKDDKKSISTLIFLLSSSLNILTLNKIRHEDNL